MALIDDMRLAVRVSCTDLDSEIQMLIDGALADLEYSGVSPALLDPENLEPQAKVAVCMYVKEHWGFDLGEFDGPRFTEQYRLAKIALLNSARNIAAGSR